MRDLDQSLSLLEMSWKDFKALCGMLDADVFDQEIFGFHVQQAAEKAFKSLLALNVGEYPKVHDLRLLIRELQNAGADIAPFLSLLEFNTYAVQFRYEALGAPDEPIDRENVIREIRLLLEQVQRAVADACAKDGTR
ncbi:MAG TPA: HEPN domain-containing protein [bacterium]|nr:HEPN domain-containing protein [bacterium]